MLKAVSILLLFASDLIKAPATVPSDRGTVVVSDKTGGRRWTANWTMEPVERNGKKAVRFTERGQGHVSPFSQEIRWSLESLWSAETDLLPMDSEKVISGPTGERLLTERKHFDAATGIVRFERQRPDGRPEVKSLKIPADTLIVEGIAGILRYFPFGQTGRLPAHLLTNDPRLYSVVFEIRGKERVKSPAGEFDCYKMEMVPYLGVLNVVRSFFPKTFFWFTVAAPHFWVRYEGLENGPGTPEIVMELDRGSR
jgi:hypothetical protein